MWLNKNTTPYSKIKKPKRSNSIILASGKKFSEIAILSMSEAELEAINIFRFTEDSIPSRRYYTYIEDIDEDAVVIGRTPVDRDIADVQVLMIKDLDLTANGKFNSATDGYTSAEMSSWSDLERDAIAHQTKPLTKGMLFDEANFAGITVDELATKVLVNATALKQYKSFVSGTRKKKTSEIEALTTVDECILYEATPYTYTYTEEDAADEMNDVIVGDTTVRYRNNVKEW